MLGINKKCFVCQAEVGEENSVLNLEVNLRVCDDCKGTSEEKRIIDELLDSLADDLFCGCI